jgi:hypothetical protein
MNGRASVVVMDGTWEGMVEGTSDGATLRTPTGVLDWGFQTWVWLVIRTVLQ